MSVRMQPNSTRISQEPVEISVTVEEDNGIFLAIYASISGETPDMDLFTVDPGEIDQFFADVEEARLNWVSLRRGKG